MHGINAFRVCIICLLTCCISSITLAAPSFSFGFNNNSPGNDRQTTTNRPWGNIGNFKPGLKVERNFNNTGNGYNYSYSYSYNSANDPAPASNGYYIGGAPGTGWPSAGNPMGMPYSTSPYAGQMPQGTTSNQPRVEVSLSETNPYEQQNVVYTVHVISQNNLKVLNPILPSTRDAALEIVDGPVPSARKGSRNSASEIVNTYRMKLTPLRSGEIVIPPVRFNGTQMSSNRQWGMRPGTAGEESFDITSGKPVTLRVKSADPAIEPWLPLQDLQLQTQMLQEQPAREGIPVTLTVDLVAKGALGDQLPSLEQQLKSKDFRVYRESTTTKKGVSKNGKYLIGSRRETYTLIPLKDGPIRLPRLGVSWWDINLGMPQIAGEQDHFGSAAGARNRQTSPDSGTSSAYPSYFWFPLLITLGLIIGYWLGAWARTRPVFRNAITGAVNVLRPLKKHSAKALRATMRSLSLNRYLNYVRMSVASVMPMQIKLWMCTRCVQQENNPGEWCYNFKNRICQHLGISSHTPLPEVAEKLIAANPHLEPDKIRSMVRSLDAAMYGGQQLDFTAWKRDLSDQLRPRARRRKRLSLRTKTVLPDLNPHSA